MEARQRRHAEFIAPPQINYSNLYPHPEPNDPLPQLPNALVSLISKFDKPVSPTNTTATNIDLSSTSKLKPFDTVNLSQIKFLGNAASTPANLPSEIAAKGITTNKKYAAIGWNTCKKVVLLRSEDPQIPPTVGAKLEPSQNAAITPAIFSRKGSRFTDFNLSNLNEDMLLTADSMGFISLYDLSKEFTAPIFEKQLDSSVVSSALAFKDFSDGVYTGNVKSVNFNPNDLNYILSSYSNSLVTCWNVETGNVQASFKDKCQLLYSIKFDYSGRLVFVFICSF
jgi:WD40 repeat protein